MPSAGTARRFTVALHARGKTESYTALAHPPRDTAWIADYEGVIRNIFSNYRPGTDKGETPYRIATDHGRVRANTGPTLDERLFIFIPPYDGAARIYHIGEYHGRSAKYVVFQNNAGIKRDIILDLHIRSYPNPRSYK